MPLSCFMSALTSILPRSTGAAAGGVAGGPPVAARETAVATATTVAAAKATAAPAANGALAERRDRSGIFARGVLEAALEAVPELGDELAHLRQVGSAEVLRQLVQDRFGPRPVDVEQARDVVLVEADAQVLALAIERGQGIELEQQQALDRGAGDRLPRQVVEVL